MSERRQSPRYRTYLGGQIVVHDGNSIVDCLVRNLSGTGARLDFSGPCGVGAVPDAFDLAIRHKDESLRARVVWRTATSAGVTFDMQGDAAVAPNAAARRIPPREDARHQLGRRVAELSGSM